ncbi:hypothetical protein [Devosia sp. 2618]|uniref:hypothetical protein n=1 Tax=Devosia sp. 2618 TaxID=3156454 RepID=UPI0033969746
MDPLLHNPEITMGLELRNNLKAIYRGRLAQGHAVGSLEGWARSIAFASARIDAEVTTGTVAKHMQWIGIDIPESFITRVSAEVAAAKAADALQFDPQMIGEMVQLTAAEREEYRIRRLIEACDENQRERINRQRREKRGARPRSHSITATQPWVRDGYRCRRTWERNGKSPKVSQKRSTTKEIHKEEWCSTKVATNDGFSTKPATLGDCEDE